MTNLGELDFLNHSHQNIASSLALLNVPLPTSEVHGLCCGLLCAQPSSAAKTRWFTEVLDSASLSPAEVAGNATPLKLLDEWFGQTLSSMNDADLEFTPTLPEDDVPVPERLRALGDFCAGFTYGIGLTMAQRGNRPLPEDTREIIEDFQAIDAADPADQADDDGETPSIDHQEGMYVELLEYVRVGVLLVLEELRPISPARQEKLS
ncbi:MAG: UPF0149 family protein [Granulosicoccus sp.]